MFAARGAFYRGAFYSGCCFENCGGQVRQFLQLGGDVLLVEESHLRFEYGLRPLSRGNKLFFVRRATDNARIRKSDEAATRERVHKLPKVEALCTIARRVERNGARQYHPLYSLRGAISDRPRGKNGGRLG